MRASWRGLRLMKLVRLRVKDVDLVRCTATGVNGLGVVSPLDRM